MTVHTTRGDINFIDSLSLSLVLVIHFLKISYVCDISIGPTSVNITWSAPANANGILLQYNVYIETKNGGQFNMLTIFNVTADPKILSYSFSCTNLLAFTLYRIKVSATTRIGEGASTYVSVTTDPDTASPPSFVSARELNSTALELLWGYPEIIWGNITGYIIYHNVTGERWLNTTLSVMNDMGNQTLLFVDLVPHTYYRFSVAAFSVTETQIHYGILSHYIVARTEEDCKILRNN